MPSARRLSIVYLLVLPLFLGAAATAHAQCSVAYTFDGVMPEDGFGWSVSGAGDVNGDGFDDVIVGARGVDAGGNFAGRAYVYSGQTGSLLYTFTGEAAGDGLGGSASGAGDVNNDGYDDVIVGAIGNDTGGNSAGRAYVHSGQDGSVLHTFTGEASDDGLGASVSGAGDVNNDGYADLIVGAHWNDAGGSHAGRAYVYSGQTGSLLYTFDGEAAGDYLGKSVSGAGDVNNDGHGDVIVGAYGNDAGGSGAGRAYVYSGQDGSLVFTFTGEAAHHWFGWSVSDAGDVNGDGFDDVIVGGSNTERAYVYSGETGGVLFAPTGETPADDFGCSVSGAGDVNGDGFDDVIVGALAYIGLGSQTGRAYVYSGSNGSLLYTFTGESYRDQFGSSVSGAGDINGDGIADLIVGARYANAWGSTDAGRAYVFTCIPPAIPTLTEWGMIALGLLLLGGLGWYARRLRAAVTTVT